ncbi:Tn3 family transposase [Bacillus sp. 166amftsu]|uniref:Tn3 family transposase n=1 Tax=Bacillus sp. 166amftsu TaxID=1761753 RepID=UPI0011149D96|nr:Tn3 family transposase [Bacillus sp. 166amftsu]
MEINVTRLVYRTLVNIVGKLSSYTRQNIVAKALREIGRIEKTIFILDYLSNKPMRRQIQRGLNKFILFRRQDNAYNDSSHVEHQNPFFQLFAREPKIIQLYITIRNKITKLIEKYFIRDSFLI